MNHSEPDGEYPELNWSGFRIPFRITPKVAFDTLISGLLAVGLIEQGVFGGALALWAILMIWKSLESRLDRIESKLSKDTSRGL
jgi:hypothetical protein